MKDRFVLQPSETENHFVVTDKQNGIVIRFKRFQFNKTQNVTMLNDVTPDANALAKAMAEIADWLATNHYFVAMPFDANVYGLFWARKIKELREAKGLSRYRLSGESHKLFGQGNGVNANHIMQIERCEHVIKIDTLYKVLATLGYELDAVLL